MTDTLEQRARGLLASEFPLADGFSAVLVRDMSIPQLGVVDTAIALRAIVAALQAQQPGAQVVELVDLSTALARVRARASESGTAKQHGPQFAAGLRAAANMLEGMRIAQPPSIPEPSEDDAKVAECDRVRHLKAISAYGSAGVDERYDMAMRAALTTYTARLRERIGGAR